MLYASGSRNLNFRFLYLYPYMSTHKHSYTKRYKYKENITAILTHLRFSYLHHRTIVVSAKWPGRTIFITSDRQVR